MALVIEDPNKLPEYNSLSVLTVTRVRDILRCTKSVTVQVSRKDYLDSSSSIHSRIELESRSFKSPTTQTALEAGDCPNPANNNNLSLSTRASAVLEQSDASSEAGISVISELGSREYGEIGRSTGSQGIL